MKRNKQRKKHKVQTSMFNGYKCLQKGAGKMQIKGQKRHNLSATVSRLLSNSCELDFQ